MYREKIKVLDCTIRDGGLINNHDFDHRFVREVYKAVSAAGVDYMEMGYKNSRSLFSPKEFGPWKFCDDKDIRKVTEGIESKTRISVMGDVGRMDMDDVKPASESPVELIRVASYVKDIEKAIFMGNNYAEKFYYKTNKITEQS